MARNNIGFSTYDDSCYEEDNSSRPDSFSSVSLPTQNRSNRPKLRLVHTNNNKKYNNNNMKKYDYFNLLILKTFTYLFVWKDTRIPMFQFKNEEYIRNNSYISESNNACKHQYEFIEYCYEQSESEYTKRLKYTLFCIKDIFIVGYRYNSKGLLFMLREIINGRFKFSLR